MPFLLFRKLKMKMKDAFEKYPDLQQEIINIDSTFNRPNIMCKTFWKKLEKLNNSKDKLKTKELMTISFSINKNDNNNKTLGERIDESIKKNLRQKIPSYNSYFVEYVHGPTYSATFGIGLSVSYNSEESNEDYNKRMNLLKIKSLFIKYILHDMEQFEKHKEQILLDKKKLKEAYDEEVKYLKEKYKQK